MWRCRPSRAAFWPSRITLYIAAGRCSGCRGHQFISTHGKNHATAPTGRRRLWLNRHSAHPYHGAGEVDEGKEVDGSAVVTGCDTSEVLEFVEAPFNPIPQSIDVAAVIVRQLSPGMWRDDSDCADG